MDLIDVTGTLTQGFLLFFVVGFLAQLVDGALGMAYGVISSSVLLAFGVPPAQASAMIHAAECVTTGASGASHVLHKNIDWKLFFRLAPAGIIGGVAGAYVLTGLNQDFVKAVVIFYLGVLGAWIFVRAIRGLKDAEPHLKHVVPLGVVGGFVDASGGGGWGPVVATTLMGRGHTPRFVIGSVNLSEFFVTMAVSATFVWAFLTGRFAFEGGLAGAGVALGGLVLGGVIAAPIAGYVTKLLPARGLMGAVGVLVVGLSVWQGITLWPRLLEYPIFTAQLTALVNPH